MHIGLDHFALPGDSLAAAMRESRLRRNFQGYTDDDASTLIAFGASSISATPLGYMQNIVETGAYRPPFSQARCPPPRASRSAGRTSCAPPSSSA